MPGFGTGQCYCCGSGAGQRWKNTTVICQDCVADQSVPAVDLTNLIVNAGSEMSRQSIMEGIAAARVVRTVNPPAPESPQWNGGLDYDQTH